MSENKDELTFLPTLNPMPTPPRDSDNIEQWQKHAMAMDKYVLDMNVLIEQMENNDFPTAFKQKIAEQGIDIDGTDVLPYSLLEEIAEKINNLLHKFEVASRGFGVQTGQMHKPSIVKTNRNIKSI
jgi:hypothetical protein